MQPTNTIEKTTHKRYFHNFFQQPNNGKITNHLNTNEKKFRYMMKYRSVELDDAFQ